MTKTIKNFHAKNPKCGIVWKSTDGELFSKKVIQPFGEMHLIQTFPEFWGDDLGEMQISATVFPLKPDQPTNKLNKIGEIL